MVASTLRLSPLSNNPVLVATCRRAYAAALKREEACESVEKAWHLARDTEFALARLEAATKGLPLPRPLVPRTARNMAIGGMRALGAFGLGVARAVARQASLVKARAALAAKRAARPRRPLLARVRSFLGAMVASVKAVVVSVVEFARSAMTFVATPSWEDDIRVDIILAVDRHAPPYARPRSLFVA